MTTIIEKCRNLVEDILITNGIDNFDYLTGGSKIFNLSQSNIDATTIKVYKNGVLWSMSPVAGSSVAWTRVGTVVTITKVGHGLITGDIITITVSSDITALPLDTKVITKLTADTFTVVGLNAGAASGTCTYTVTDNYSYNSNTGKLTVTGTLTGGDTLEVTYSYYMKYSDNELRGYIKAAISYLSVEKYKTFAIKSDNVIFPTPEESEENLIAIIAAILIKGNIRSYRTPEITVVFNDSDSKEKKIRKIVRQFKKVYGVLDYIKMDEKIVLEEDY